MNQIEGVKNYREKLQRVPYFCSTDQIKINAKIAPHEDYLFWRTLFVVCTIEVLENSNVEI
jgi:hypothetical protein